MSELTDLEKKIIKIIVKECNIDKEDIPDNISPNDAIIGDESPFGLDSLDGIEIVVAIQREFGVRIGDTEITRKLMTSFRTLSEYIEKNLSTTSLRRR